MLWPTAEYDNPIQNYPNPRNAVVCLPAKGSYGD
jgi:hypothetical protein